MLGSSSYQVSLGSLVVYVPPTFNQSCEVVGKQPGHPDDPPFDTVCQVRGVTRLRATPSTGNNDEPASNVLICFPARTSVYGSETDGGKYSVVDVGDDDGVSYVLLAVWDVAQYFSNEYRMAIARRLSPLPGQ